MSLPLENNDSTADSIHEGLYLIGYGLRQYKDSGATNEEVKEYVRDIVAALQLFIGNISDV